MASEPSSRGWVWHSTPQSIGAGKPSILAIFEIVVALALYFGAARVFGWWLPILTSAIAAPLVLLRSEASVGRAETMWGEYDRKGDRDEIPRSELILFVVPGLTVSFAVSWWLATHWLDGHAGWDLYWRSTMIGILAINISIAVAVAGARVLLIGSGFAIGIFIRTLFIRVASILPEWRDGLIDLPANWRRVMLHEDLWHPPELLPGVSREAMAVYNPRGVWKMTDDKTGLAYGMFYLLKTLLIIIWFAPAILWRFALKSTFWLYGPALLIAYPKAEGRQQWLSRRMTAWERHQWILALILLGVSLATLTGFSALFGMWAQASEAGVPFFLTWALTLDWGALLTQPWRLLSLLNLICALAIFYWRDHLRACIKNGETVSMQGWPVGCLMCLARLQIGIFIFYWLVSLWNLAHYLDASGKLTLPW